MLSSTWCYSNYWEEKGKKFGGKIRNMTSSLLTLFLITKYCIYITLVFSQVSLAYKSSNNVFKSEETVENQLELLQVEKVEMKVQKK